MLGKKMMVDLIKHECDDIIIEILSEKLDIHVVRDKDDIVFTVKFAGQLVKEDRVSIK